MQNHNFDWLAAYSAAAYEVIGTMPPRMNDKPTYVTIKNDMTDS